MDTTPTDSADPMPGLTAAALDPLFWPVSRSGVHSAWITHVPFAHWLVTQHRPRSIVELGTHNGVSYSAFCDAVQRNGLDCRCMAVDTWQGDEHAGFYGAEVYEDLRRFHDAHYAAFSDLRRSTFAQALDTVPDASVDLLHIDGLHTYEAVRADFEAWLPKLSPRAVVLFHDTTVREHGFGVWRLWAELSQRYPSFEFLHGHGLGVLGVGPDRGPAMHALAALPDRAVGALRERFALIGERWRLEMLAGQTEAALRQETRGLQQQLTDRIQELAAARPGRSPPAPVSRGFLRLRRGDRRGDLRERPCRTDLRRQGVCCLLRQPPGDDCMACRGRGVVAR